MKKLILLGAAMSFVFSGVSLADGEHGHGSMEHASMQKEGMPMMGDKSMKKSPEMMKKCETMHAEVVEIQKEPDLAKRQSRMAEHQKKKQEMMAQKGGMAMSPEMMKKRQKMQDEMEKITNEPDSDKRQAMLKEHMKKMKGMMEEKKGSMNEDGKSGEHNH